MGFLSSAFGYALNFLYELVSNYGIAIIIFSIGLRIILLPITFKQQQTQKKTAKIQGKLSEIQKKYKNDPEKLNQETMALYKSEKMSPFSGCLSGIIQILIILSVFWLVSQPLTYMLKVETNEELKNIVQEYKDEINNSDNKGTYIEIQVISKIEEEYKQVVEKLNNWDENSQNIDTTVVDENNNNEENKEQQENTENTEKEEKKILTKEDYEKRKENLEKLRINMDFIGLDLSKVPTQNLNDWKVYIIPVLYVITSFISIKLTTVNNKKKKENELINTDNKEETEASNTDQMQQMSNTMMYMMPIMSISIALIAPLGLALYWFTSNLLMIVERLIINKIINSKEDEQDGE